MNFGSNAERIHPLREIETIKSTGKKIVQKRPQVKNTELKRTSINQVQLASLDNKCYYLSDGIIEKEKNNLLKLENAENEILVIFSSIYAIQFTYYILNTNNKVTTDSSWRFDFINTRDYILKSKWLWNVNNIAAVDYHSFNHRQSEIMFTKQISIGISTMLEEQGAARLILFKN